MEIELVDAWLVTMKTPEKLVRLTGQPLTETSSGAVSHSNRGADCNGVDSIEVPMRQQERWLMQAIAGGSQGELDQLLSLHQGDVRRMIGRLTAWGPDVDDLTQEVFLTAWRSAHAFTGQGTLRNWLLSIAVNKCRNHHRATSRMLKAVMGFAMRLGLEQPRTYREEDDKPIEDQSWTTLQLALAQLSATDRQLLVLIVMEQQSAQQVAELLNIKESTLYVRLHRAKARLLLAAQRKL